VDGRQHFMMTHAGVRAASAARISATKPPRPDPDDRRESTKARITLATVHAVAGEPRAERSAAAALNGAEALHSVRVRSQLEPLETALAKRPTSTYTDLANRAQAIRLAA
jgi:hypothetical protein